MPRTETPEQRSQRRAAEKIKKLAEEAAAGIHRHPAHRPPAGTQWDERLGQFVDLPPPSAPALPVAAITAAMTTASVAESSASTSAAASSSAQPLPGVVASTPTGTMTITTEEAQHLLQRRAAQQHLTSIARAAAAGREAADSPNSSTHAVADAIDAHASLIAKLRNAQKHWEACVAFDRSTRPTRQIYDHVHAQLARAGRPPFYPPWEEWEQDYYEPEFPEIHSGCCDECVDAFREKGESFEPCEFCLKFERMLCSAGGGFPAYTQGSRESVALPPYLLGRQPRAHTSESESDD